MRIERLDLTRYGRFSDYVIDFGARPGTSPDFHVVYGLNEAGKSTVAAAILDLLFGIEERSRYGAAKGRASVAELARLQRDADRRAAGTERLGGRGRAPEARQGEPRRQDNLGRSTRPR